MRAASRLSLGCFSCIAFLLLICAAGLPYVRMGSTLPKTPASAHLQHNMEGSDAEAGPGGGRGGERHPPWSAELGGTSASVTLRRGSFSAVVTREDHRVFRVRHPSRGPPAAQESQHYTIR